MILINPRKEIVIASKLHVGMQGRMRFICWRPDHYLHRARVDTGWFPNKLLLSGMNEMPNRSDWLDRAQVGTDSTPPLATDTGLLGRVAGTSTIQVTNVGAQSSEPWFGWKRRTYRFPQGAGHGGQNISEGGVGWSTTGANLICRALVVDPITQVPTSVTPLEDELMDMLYELRYYPPLDDVPNSVTLLGTDYDVITRASRVNNSTYWASPIGSAIGEFSATNSDWSAYDGTLGLLNAGPNGVSAACDNANQSNIAYSNNSYERHMECNTGPTGWNLDNEIRTIEISTTVGRYKSQFSSNPGNNPIPKTILHQMHMAWTVGWSEYDS